ncbi:hypothetical protein K3Z98_11780, partial [Pseudomonas aeruginosa]|nr:hypothetical protein [Pseudomonas aeruginosa]
MGRRWLAAQWYLQRCSMAELQRASVTGGGLYERLLQRLALALDEADT